MKPDNPIWGSITITGNQILLFRMNAIYPMARYGLLDCYGFCMRQPIQILSCFLKSPNYHFIHQLFGNFP